MTRQTLELDSGYTLSEAALALLLAVALAAVPVGAVLVGSMA